MRGNGSLHALRGWPRMRAYPELRCLPASLRASRQEEVRIVKDPSLSSVIRSRLPRIEDLKPSDQSKRFPLSLTFPIRANLKDGSPVQLVLAGDRDVEPLRDLYRIIVEEGTSYPHDRFPMIMTLWIIGSGAGARWQPTRRIEPTRHQWRGPFTSDQTGRDGQGRSRTPGSWWRLSGA